MCRWISEEEHHKLTWYIHSLCLFPFKTDRVKFHLYSSFRAAIKVGVMYRWAYPKVYVFRRLIFIASAEWHCGRHHTNFERVCRSGGLIVLHNQIWTSLFDGTGEKFYTNRPCGILTNTQNTLTSIFVSIQHLRWRDQCLPRMRYYEKVEFLWK